MTGNEIEEIVKPLETDDFTEHNRSIIAENLKEELKYNALIKVIAMEKMVVPENDNKGENNA